jgi:hypothetical protein
VGSQQLPVTVEPVVAIHLIILQGVLDDEADIPPPPAYIRGYSVTLFKWYKVTK